MQKKKDSKGNQDARPGAGAASVGLQSKRIQDQLRTTEEIIRTLKNDLEHFRSENASLLKERNDLLKTIAQMNAADEGRIGLENELGFINEERDRLANQLRLLQHEKKQLMHRVSLLEKTLTHDRQKLEEAKGVIVCLEAQVEQLESLVTMLREHKVFMQE